MKICITSAFRIKREPVSLGNSMQRKNKRQNLFLAAGCLGCTVVALRSFWVFDGAEFGGGSLVSGAYLGAFLFVLALVAALKYPRLAALSALCACLLSLPLYLYLVFPRPFRLVWPGPWEGSPPQAMFVWDGWWMGGILLIIFVASLCCGRLVPIKK